MFIYENGRNVIDTEGVLDQHFEILSPVSPEQHELIHSACLAAPYVCCLRYYAFGSYDRSLSITQLCGDVFLVTVDNQSTLRRWNNPEGFKDARMIGELVRRMMPTEIQWMREFGGISVRRNIDLAEECDGYIIDKNGLRWYPTL